MEQVIPGDYLLISYKSTRSTRQFVGLATDSDSETFKVQFLRKNDDMGFVYILPSKEDKGWIGAEKVIRKPTPVVDDRNRYHFR